MKKLNDKVAVVTGGNSGIGLATAKRFAEEGARVIITGRRREAVEEAASELGPKVSGLVADAASLADTDRMLEQIREEHGRIDVLFLNAGVAPFAPITETGEKDFDRVFDINVKGLFFTLQKAYPLMSDGGSIILNASVVHKAGYPGAGAYAASKAAVRSIGQTAAAEFASRGIRVNLLSPGPVETPIFGKAGLSDEALEEVGREMAKDVPLGRFGRPAEMANVALFLASEESGFVTGSDFQADGGYSQSF